MSKNVEYKRRRARTKRHNRSLRNLNSRIVNYNYHGFCCALHGIVSVDVEDLTSKQLVKLLSMSKTPCISVALKNFK